MGIHDFTLADMIRRNATQFPERTAFVMDGRRITHRAYQERIARLAGGLAAHGVGAGDRVGVLAQNCLEFADLYGAAAWLGAILLPVNWRLSAEEIAYVLGDGAPRLVVAGAEYQELLAGLAPRLSSVTGWFALGEPRGSFQSFARLTSAMPAGANVNARPQDGYVIIHTAAVDGRPRGALLSHGGLIAASLQLGQMWALGDSDVNLGVLPLFHLAGLGMMLAVQQFGGTSAIVAKFDAEAAGRLIAAERATILAEFAPMLGGILDKAKETGADLSSLRAVTGLDSPDTIKRFEAACPSARFWAAYGQSETCGFVTMSRFAERPGSAGRPAPLMRVAVVDELDQELAAGAVGEIVVRGPMVFNGYWNRAEDNAVTFRNGWHHTGDMGRFDADGYLWYAGRSPAKELIKPGGENVYPAEVEKTLREHPAIADAVVIGVPDAQWGEAVKAVCLCRPGLSVAAEELIEFVGSRIARYKKPKHVVFVDRLPLAPNGSVDRTQVKQQHGAAS